MHETVRLTDEQQSLVAENRFLVRHLLKRWCARHWPHCKTADREDMESHGLVALCQAAQRFDPSRGLKFATYAGRCVWMQFHSHLTYHQGLIRVPAYRERVKVRPMPYRRTRNGEAEECTLPAPEPPECHSDEAALILRACLPEERRILRLIYWDGLTQREAAEALGMSHQGAACRLNRLLERLRRRFTGK